MSSIWDNAPEGAERYLTSEDVFLKSVDGDVWFYNGLSQWVKLCAEDSYADDCWSDAVRRAVSGKEKSTGENSGGSCDYYKCPIKKPTTELLQENLGDGVVYVAECNDVIENLDMTYAEANMFKEIWRSAAARTLGKKKAGHTDIRGAEKIVFFADRNLIQKQE